MRTGETLEGNKTGKLRERMILQTTALHNLPVRNIPVKELNRRGLGAAFGRNQN
jgi:hypothetical protein